MAGNDLPEIVAKDVTLQPGRTYSFSEIFDYKQVVGNTNPVGRPIEYVMGATPITEDTGYTVGGGARDVFDTYLMYDFEGASSVFGPTFGSPPSFTTGTLHISSDTTEDIRVSFSFNSGYHTSEGQPWLTGFISYSDIILQVGDDVIFTSSRNVINFDNLNSDHLRAVNAGAALYDAMGGDDIVVLPSTRDIGNMRWYPTTVFSGGDGIDSITGGSLSDRIRGGAGNDMINGGEGQNMSYLSGSGSAYALIFEGPLQWRTIGPDGNDLHTLIQSFAFDNFRVTQDQAFAQLLDRAKVRDAVDEIQRLMDRDRALSGLISDGRQFVAEARNAQSLAEILLLTEVAKGLIGKLAEVEGGPIWAAGNAAAQMIGELLGLNLFRGAANERAEAIVEGAASILNEYFKSGTVEYLLERTEEDDFDETVSDWRAAANTMGDMFDQIEEWKDQQARIRNTVFDLETELRDRYAFAEGMPKVRYNGESTETPSVMGTFETFTRPDPRTIGLSTSENGRVDSYASETLKTQETELHLKGVAYRGNGNSQDNALYGNRVANYLFGDGGADRLSGGRGTDQLSGGTGKDLLYGGSGSDKLYGGNSADELSGSSGNDRLNGGRGADLLDGGMGRDVFVFSSISHSPTGSGADRIEDFGPGDVVDVSAIDANELRTGSQSFAFIGSSSWSGEAGELRYSRGNLWADVDGDRSADLKIALAGAPDLTAEGLLL